MGAAGLEAVPAWKRASHKRGSKSRLLCPEGPACHCSPRAVSCAAPALAARPYRFAQLQSLLATVVWQRPSLRTCGCCQRCPARSWVRSACRLLPCVLGAQCEGGCLLCSEQSPRRLPSTEVGSPFLEMSNTQRDAAWGSGAVALMGRDGAGHNQSCSAPGLGAARRAHRDSPAGPACWVRMFSVSRVPSRWHGHARDGGILPWGPWLRPQAGSGHCSLQRSAPLTQHHAPATFQVLATLFF